MSKLSSGYLLLYAVMIPYSNILYFIWIAWLIWYVLYTSCRYWSFTNWSIPLSEISRVQSNPSSLRRKHFDFGFGFHKNNRNANTVCSVQLCTWNGMPAWMLKIIFLLSMRDLDTDKSVHHNAIQLRTCIGPLRSTWSTLVQIMVCQYLYRCWPIISGDLWNNTHHNNVIKWKHFPRYWPFVRGIYRPRWIPRTKASDAELWCFLWSANEEMILQTVVRLVIWDAIELIMMSP